VTLDSLGYGLHFEGRVRQIEANALSKLNRALLNIGRSGRGGLDRA